MVADRTAFDVIVDRFAERVFNQAYRMLGNREDAEEATQDVFMRIHRSLETFRGEAQISTWIWRITANVCITRRSGRRPPGAEAVLPDEIPDPSAGPYEALIDDEDRRRLGKIIARLPEREAAAITLFYIEGLDYTGIADALALSSGSVATALHRGREHLGKILLEERERGLT